MNNSSGVNTILIVVVLVLIVGGGIWWYKTYGPGMDKQNDGLKIEIGGSDQ